MENFEKHQKLLQEVLEISYENPHPASIILSEMTTAEVLDMTTEIEANRKPQTKNQYKKRILEVKDVEGIN